MKNFLSVTAAVATVAIVSGCKPRTYNSDGNASSIQNGNLFGRDLAIGKGNIALTFDDGPGERAVELAKYLAENDVPATFFVQGSSAARYESDLAAIAALKLKSGKRAHYIANHTYTHCDVSDPRSDAYGEVSRTHKLVKKYQESLPLFYRSPYGATVSSADRCRINEDQSLKTYVGSVFWDIGGQLSGSYGADWACWPDGLSAQDCGNRYIAETVARGGGILLAHDIHSKTVDMTKYIVPILKAKGFKFVALDVNAKAIEQLGGKATPSLPSASVSVGADSSDSTGKTLRFKVSCDGCAKTELWVNGLDTPLHVETAAPQEFVYSRQFSNVGTRMLDVRGFDASGVQIRSGSISFFVGRPAEAKCIIEGSDGSGNLRDAANGNLLKKIPNGAAVTTMGSMQDGWYQVRLEGRVEGAALGWMHNSVLSCGR